MYTECQQIQLTHCIDMQIKTIPQGLRQELQTILVRFTSGSCFCLHPESPHNYCGETVKSHAIQKSFLRQISNDCGQVYTQHTSLSSPNDIVRMKLTGINNASTFRGFCERHDNELFAPIEDQPLQLNNEHALLLNYRSLCREIYLMVQLLANYKRYFVDEDVDNPTYYKWLSMFFHLHTGTHCWFTDYSQMSEMREAISNSDFSQTFFCAIEFDRAPDILACASITPTIDVHGKELQAPFQGYLLDTISVSLLPYSGGKGVAVFAWHGNSTVNEKFIESLQSLAYGDIPDTIVRFLFHHVKEIYFSPRWWDALSTDARGSLSRRLLHAFRVDHPAILIVNLTAIATSIGK